MAESRVGQPHADPPSADPPSADPPSADPAGPVLALARVLGLDAGALRSDTPLGSIGWDSLARVCWQDAVLELGWRCQGPANATTVGDLVRQCSHERIAGGRDSVEGRDDE